MLVSVYIELYLLYRQPHLYKLDQPAVLILSDSDVFTGNLLELINLQFLNAPHDAKWVIQKLRANEELLKSDVIFSLLCFSACLQLWFSFLNVEVLFFFFLNDHRTQMMQYDDNRRLPAKTRL